MKRILSTLLFASPLFASGAYIFAPSFCHGAVCDTGTQLYRLFVTPDFSGIFFRFALLLFFASSFIVAYSLFSGDDG